MIQMSSPSLGPEELTAIQSVFHHGYLGGGSEAAHFEELLQSYFGRRVVSVSSGTAALHCSLEAAGIGAGDEVLVQSLTFAATFQAVTAVGATPVACDILRSDLSLDLQDAASRLTHRTKAIIPVLYAGHPGELTAAGEFARQHGIRLVVDAAHAFGGSYQGAPIGANGDIVCFSFDPIKTVTCGEGGCIVTDDKDIVKRVVEMRRLGFALNTTDGHEKRHQTIVRRGGRYHLSNINAAIGLTQFSKLNSLVEARRSIARQYSEALTNNSSLELLPYDYNCIAPYIYVVLLREKEASTVIGEMAQRGIECGNHYFPPHLHSYYKLKDVHHIPVVESVYSRLLTLPLHPGLTREDIDFVVKELRTVISK